MSEIISKKSYSLSTKQGVFKLFVAEHDTGWFYATLLHWSLVGKRFLSAPNDPERGYLQADYEMRTGRSEQEALDALMIWIEKNFDDVQSPKLI